MHAKPTIRSPRTRAKPEWAPSRGSRRVPGHGDCAAASWVHKTRTTNSRLQVRSPVKPYVTLIEGGWVDLYRSGGSTTLPVLRHKLLRSTGTHGVRMALPFW